MDLFLDHQDQWFYFYQLQPGQTKLSPWLNVNTLKSVWGGCKNKMPVVWLHHRLQSTYLDKQTEMKGILVEKGPYTRYTVKVHQTGLSLSRSVSPDNRGKLRFLLVEAWRWLSAWTEAIDSFWMPMKAAVQSFRDTSRWCKESYK